MTTLLWIDVETDGLDPERDHLLEVGLLATGSDLEPLDGGVFSPIRFDGPVDAFIGRMHGPNGLLDGLGHRSLDVSAVDEASRLWAPDVRAARPDRTTDHRVRHCLADSIALARYYKEALWDRSQG